MHRMTIGMLAVGALTASGCGSNSTFANKPRPAAPVNLTVYIDVDDLAAYRQRIVAERGKIHVEEQEVPGMGAFTLFSDPEGRLMGLWKAAKK